jgi:hypothetical protein
LLLLSLSAPIETIKLPPLKALSSDLVDDGFAIVRPLADEDLATLVDRQIDRPSD